MRFTIRGIIDRLLYLHEFESMEHFKKKLIEYMDYYNNRRIREKLKGLPPALRRQQALSVAWTVFTSKYCLTFWGHFIFPTGTFFLISTFVGYLAEKNCGNVMKMV